MTRTARRDRGFTLVELLVSLAILAMTSLLLVQGLHGGRRVWDRIATRGHEGDTVLTAQARLADLIDRAIPETSFAGSRPFARFDGAAATLAFLGDGGAGTQLLTLALATDGTLRLQARPDLAPAGAAIPTTAAPVIDGVRAIEFGYFGAAQPDNERRWRPAWRNQPTLPELIRVRLAFADGDRRRWPELVAHPAATIDTACVFTPATGRCKGRG